MALETPNRLAASIVFYFAEVDGQPPGLSNPFTLIITAINAVNSIQTVAVDSLLQGFFLELQEKITPDLGSFFVSGTPVEDAAQVGFTPSVQLPGDPVADEFAQTEGNFLMYQPDIEALFGMMSVSMWAIPPTDAELPVSLPL